ncbi:CBS domain-containing protein [Pseudonocardia bannensis]|uniref:CBS domain-containing protein n=1 Tax=Pseudonocardia bannensis TaxID=630973 RepID=A0A848DF72_9PSEU|nr:CBS domain-containing protein [Pseudonocardia bannensis]NMH91236.1 CBS domain-containing protein [Pseudonocardia bannensis]
MNPPGLRRTRVREVMTTAVVSVAPETGFDEVARVLVANAVRAVPVLDPDGRLLGVVSEADLMDTTQEDDPARRTVRDRRPWHRRPHHAARPTTARELMTTPVIGVGPEAGVAEAARVMHERGLGWLAVVEPETSGGPGGRLVGVLGRSDLLKAFLRDDAELRAEVVDQVLGRMLLVDPARVDVQVSGGVVTLTGLLPTRADTRLAVSFVERLEGVVAVVDRLAYQVDERAADSPVAPLY